MKNYLPSNLRHLRTRRRLKQEEFAKIFGVARSTVGNYENGTTEPNIEMMIRFSEYFKIDLNDLILKDLSQDGTDEIPFFLEEPDLEYLAKDRFQILNEKLDKIKELLESSS